MKDITTALIIFDNEALQTVVREVLEEQKYRVVLATNSNEARLKFSNEQFHLIVLDHSVKAFKGAEYIEGIRRKESAKSVGEIIPVLVVCDRPDEYTQKYSQIDNVKFY